MTVSQSAQSTISTARLTYAPKGSREDHIQVVICKSTESSHASRSGCCHGCTRAEGINNKRRRSTVHVTTAAELRNVSPCAKGSKMQLNTWDTVATLTSCCSRLCDEAGCNAQTPANLLLDLSVSNQMSRPSTSVKAAHTTVM